MAQTKNEVKEEVVATFDVDEVEATEKPKKEIGKKLVGGLKKHWKGIALASGTAVGGFFVGKHFGFKQALNSIKIDVSGITEAAEDVVEDVVEETIS